MSAGKTKDAKSASGATGPTAKELVLKQVRALPDDNSYDQILRELAFTRLVGRGLADADHGRTIDADELRERVRRWQS